MMNFPGGNLWILGCGCMTPSEFMMVNDDDDDDDGDDDSQ